MSVARKQKTVLRCWEVSLPWCGLSLAGRALEGGVRHVSGTHALQAGSLEVVVRSFLPFLAVA